MVKFSILVKGFPAEFFSNSRELRQGDPLYPFLFIIVIDALCKIIDAVVDGSFMLGFLGWGTLLVALGALISFR